LLEVVFNTKNTGHHVIPLYARHIVQSGVQQQLNWPPCYALYLTHC
jgi:hypothetical protein